MPTEVARHRVLALVMNHMLYHTSESGEYTGASMMALSNEEEDSRHHTQWSQEHTECAGTSLLLPQARSPGWCLLYKQDCVNGFSTIIQVSSVSGLYIPVASSLQMDEVQYGGMEWGNVNHPGSP
jgi:hypothetical protein